MTLETPAQPQKKGLLSGLLGGGKTYFVFALIAALVAVGGAASVLSKATATTTYYVLKQNVAARTPITQDMLQPVQVGVNSKPPRALGPADVANGDMFALVPLQAGDVISTSDAGPLNPINKNIPSGFVVASFSVDAQNAVAGKIRTGDHIDIIAQTDGNTSSNTGGVAKVVLHHVLVVDVTTDASDIASSANDGQVGSDLNPGPESAAAHGGIPSLYTVAVSPKDATTLALVRDANLMLVLSSTSGGSTPLDAENDLNSVFAPGQVADSANGS